MSEKVGIPVIVRIRPILENDSNKENILDVVSETKIALKKEGKQDKEFIFNNVYEVGSSTKELFDKHCFDIVDNATKGLNGTIMSYGMTGSGKTFTMSHDPEGGIIQNVFKALFEIIKTEENQQFIIKLSYFQIYLDNITDLLSNKNQSQRSLKIRGPDNNVYIEGLESHICKSSEDCLKLFEQGKKARKTAATKSNQVSSRSHAILKISVTNVKGSERIAKSGAVGIRQNEAAKINLSMLALTGVITALATGASHIPYKNSKLTHILRNALGGNSKTVFIANISPSAGYYSETSDALNYAQNVTKIKNSPTINEQVADSKYKELQNENEKLMKKIQDLERENEQFKIKFSENNQSESDYDSENERHKKLSEQERRRRKIKTDLKRKLKEASQNEEYMKELYELINAPQQKKRVNIELQAEIEEKRNIAKQEELKRFDNVVEYSSEELKILNFNYDELKKVDKDIVKKVKKLMKTVKSLEKDKQDLKEVSDSLRDNIETLKKREQEILYDTKNLSNDTTDNEETSYSTLNKVKKKLDENANNEMFLSKLIEIIDDLLNTNVEQENQLNSEGNNEKTADELSIENQEYNQNKLINEKNQTAAKDKETDEGNEIKKISIIKDENTVLINEKDNLRKEIDQIRLEINENSKMLKYKAEILKKYADNRFIKILEDENDYTDEDLKILVGNSSNNNDDLIQNMKKLLEKQVYIIGFYKTEIKKILMISKEEEEYCRKYFDKLNNNVQDNNVSQTCVIL